MSKKENKEHNEDMIALTQQLQLLQIKALIAELQSGEPSSGTYTAINAFLKHNEFTIDLQDMMDQISKAEQQDKDGVEIPFSIEDLGLGVVNE